MECLPGCLRPCPATFERLAREAPELLVTWVHTGFALDDADLSDACEAMGSASVDGPLRDKAAFTLTERLRHQSSIVREGAVYGLAGLGIVAFELRALAEHDPSPGVREAARDILELGKS